MPIEKKNLEICLSVHTVHCIHARTLRALALCGKGLSKIFQNIYETRPWPAMGRRALMGSSLEYSSGGYILGLSLRLASRLWCSARLRIWGLEGISLNPV